MSRLTVQQLKRDLEQGDDINIYISDRAGWKSTTAQLMMIDEALNDHPSIILRSKIDETISDSWLSDYAVKYLTSKNMTLKSKKINNYLVELYLVDMETEQRYIFAYGMYLSVAEKYKSNYFKGFEKVRYIIWEECIPNRALVQNIRYCIDKYFDQITDVLSIGSTVARYNKVQYIFFGNDIATNIINSITVGFNLLERLVVDDYIIDKAELNGRVYSFRFLYFTFAGSVEHWLNSSDMDIASDVDISKASAYPYIILTDYNKYYLYNCGTYLYLTDTKPHDIESVYKDELEFFNAYGAGDLIKKYPIKTALTILQTYYNASYSDIAQYFGDWLYVTPHFSPVKHHNANSIINIAELSMMKLPQIINLSNYNDILSLKSLLDTNRVVYKNIAIKLMSERLLNILLLA